MATAFIDSLECVICNDPIFDPRAFPCGHSFCGPPRCCLLFMETESGFSRCAVCRTVHKMRANDIKPLYGIRDYFRGDQNENTSGHWKVHVPCFSHPNQECMFWCSTCSAMICEDCFDKDHDGHFVRKLKNHLEQKLEQRLGEKLLRGLTKQNDECLKVIELKQSKKNKKNLDAVLKLKSALDNYFGFLEGTKTGGRSSKEISLLLDLLKTQFIGTGIWLNSNEKLGAEYTQNEALANGKNLSICRENLPQSNLALRSFLEVHSIYPLKVRSSDNLFVGSTLFWISTDCVNCSAHLRKKRCAEKMFQIRVNCNSLFSFFIEFELTLVNDGKASRNKILRGSWDSIQRKQIEWDCLKVSELIDPQKMWIVYSEFIEIKFVIINGNFSQCHRKQTKLMLRDN